MQNWNNAANQTITKAQLLSAYTSLSGNNHNDCDTFFQSFCPGNMTDTLNPLLHIIDKPYERLITYEQILEELRTADKSKYEQMHKGTPYFFISWLAFTIKDFGKAIFYMDSAISEDIRATALTPNPDDWQLTPAALFLLLDPSQPYAAARSIMNMITQEFQRQLTRFNANSSVNLSITQYRDNFVTPNMNNNSYRSIVSGLYVFILEYEERVKMIRLKSNYGGSIEPFLTHLFKGCLIFESLLKTEYGGTNNTLGGYLRHTNALTDLEIGQRGYSSNPVYNRDQPRPGGYTLPIILGLLPNWRSDDYKEKIIAITYAIRNTAGHDLSWPITFDQATYQEIYEAIVDSIFWFIWKVKI